MITERRRSSTASQLDLAEQRHRAKLAGFARQIETLEDDDRIDLQRIAYSVDRIGEAKMVWQTQLTTAERSRLGNDVYVAHRALGNIGIWSELRGLTLAQSLMALARMYSHASKSRLSYFLAKLGDFDPQDESQVANAISRYQLVIAKEPFAVYWKGREVQYDWEKHPESRDYFRLLCERSKCGDLLSNFDLPQRAGRRGLTYRKHRLVHGQGFPTDLAARIKVVPREGHRLDVPSEQIFMFSFDFVTTP
jgi:hypothetical protein